MHPLTSPVAHNSGAYDMKAGDRVIYTIDGRIGVADEFLSDGEALMTWDDGTHGIVNWYHLRKAPSETGNPLTEQNQQVNNGR